MPLSSQPWCSRSCRGQLSPQCHLLPAHGFGSSDGPGSFGGCREPPEGQEQSHLGDICSQVQTNCTLSPAVGLEHSLPQLCSRFAPIPAGMMPVGSAAPLCSLSDLSYPSHSVGFPHWAAQGSAIGISHLWDIFNPFRVYPPPQPHCQAAEILCRAMPSEVPRNSMGIHGFGGARGSLHIPL